MPDDIASTPPICVLGFDFGLRNIGVAVGQSITGTAQALPVIKNTESESHWQQIDQIVAVWQPHHMVVGLPLTLSGEEQHMTHHARQFSKIVQERYQRPTHLFDERFTSRVANARFVEARQLGLKRRRDAKQLDSVAACCIVEGFLAYIAQANKE